MDRRGIGPRVIFRALVATLAALLSLPALAGDRASFNAFGFSEDGRYFAFEEYGYQDGSGFPFSNIYLVDLNRDTWVSGSPFRVMDQDEAARLSVVREQAYADAQHALHSAGIDYPAEIAALNGDGALGSDGKSLHFGLPSDGLTEPRGDYTVSIETFPTTSPEPCEDYMGEAPLGFALTINEGGADRELHRDEALPSSRGCPMDYRISAVLTPIWSSALDHSVAIVSVYPFGFEGPNRRFIAVPIGH